MVGMERVMKYLILLFGFCLSLSAQNYAVLFYKDDTKTDFRNAPGCPDFWPSEVTSIRVGETIADYPGRVELTKEQFVELQATNKVAYVTWRDTTYAAYRASKAAAEETAQQTSRTKLTSLLADLKTAERDWSTLTQAQMLLIIRKQTQIIIELEAALLELKK